MTYNNNPVPHAWVDNSFDLTKFTKRGCNSKIQNIVNSLEFSIVAKEVVSGMKINLPEYYTIIDNPYTFMLLTPSSLMYGKKSELYSAHCEEIIMRRIQSKSIKPLTEAEIIAVLCERSKRGKLSQKITSICRDYYYKIFIQRLMAPLGLMDIEQKKAFEFFRSKLGNRSELISKIPSR